MITNQVAYFNLGQRLAEEVPFDELDAALRKPRSRLLTSASGPAQVKGHGTGRGFGVRVSHGKRLLVVFKRDVDGSRLG
jgi:hypothetical protein